MNRSPLSLFAVALMACSTPVSPGDDAASDSAPLGDASMASDVVVVGQDAASPDAEQPADASSSDGAVTDARAEDAAMCVVDTTSPLQRNYYCDTAAIHVLARDGAPTQVRVTARLGTGIGTRLCGVIDSVELVRSGTSLQRWDETREFLAGSTNTLVGATTAVAAVESACSDTTTRLSAYGFIVRGKDSRGPFEARCGSAESGGRWPPGVHLACHRNVELPAITATATSFMVMNVGPTTATNGALSLPHSPAMPAFAMVDTTVEVVSPTRAPFGGGGPLMGAVTRNWMNLVSESMGSGQAITQISLNAVGATFAAELCPVPSMPGPGFVPPPYFIARITGRNARGAASTETLATCTTIVR
jgi:hypothetical protein